MPSVRNANAGEIEMNAKTTAAAFFFPSPLTEGLKRYAPAVCILICGPAAPAGLARRSTPSWFPVPIKPCWRVTLRAAGGFSALERDEQGREDTHLAAAHLSAPTRRCAAERRAKPWEENGAVFIIFLKAFAATRRGIEPRTFRCREGRANCEGGGLTKVT
ncbi:hypothetical protein SKAU_G00053590 [Synaphobranchus kaupii]|uniref:Uncharacterized protein n=1 Tax=Synaphobranchus kaupii TaxID=118154 RepID=A0A9Q1G3H6_SYNKA|nr:hypothetical protein SKAU_G00053590 [Synaphobranchus kaupii]